eukprot:c27220_g1_i2 orf=373-1737(-)
MDALSHQREEQDREARSQTTSIFSLGADQLFVILQYLPVPSLLAFGMTCCRFRDLVDSDVLWAFVCEREWGSSALESWSSCSARKTSWKRLYRRMLAPRSVSCRRLHQGDVVPAARASHSMNFVSHKIAIFGGGCDGDDPTAESIVWQQSSVGTPTGRFGQSCTVVGDTLVLFGGINDKGIRQCDTWVNRGIHVANSEEKSPWQFLEVAVAPPPRGAHAGCYGGDSRVIVYGGIGSDGVRLKDTWMLDLSEEPLSSWQEVITLHSPPARSGHTLTWIGGNRMILFGGRGTRFEVLNDVWMLDMEDEFPDWVELCACKLHPAHEYPAPRAGHSATLIFGGRILVFGGEDARRSRKCDMWVLDPDAGYPANNASACVEIINASHSDIGRSKFARRFWKKLKQRGQPPGRRSFHGACAVQSGRAILLFGGMMDGNLMPLSASGLRFDAELYLLQLAP